MRTCVAVLAGAAALVGSAALAGGISIDDGDRPTRRCGDLNIRFDQRESVRDEHKLTVPASEGQPLRLRLDVNGGVVVWGGQGPDYAITVCRIAAGGSRADAEKVLRGISASASAGTLTVNGPGGARWTTFLLVNAPKGARLDIEAQNGPVSLHSVSGAVDVRAQNGPISVENGSGDYKLRADNGPLSLELSDDHWHGNFEGSTQNGPISAELPRSFASGLRIETSPWAPASCRAAVCDGARFEKSGRARVLKVGSGSPSVSLSTVNGPLSVSNSGS